MCVCVRVCVCVGDFVETEKSISNRSLPSVQVLIYLRLSCSVSRIGKNITTKALSTDDRQDVTNVYKFKEGKYI